MPPPSPTETQLRGFMVQVARANHISLDNVLRAQVNQLVTASGLQAIGGNEMAPIKDALKNGPYPTRGAGALIPYSFEYWFNYFYSELPSAQKLNFALNVVNDDGTFRTEDQIPNKIALFSKMLSLGFKKFQVADHLTAQQMQIHAAQNQDNDLQRKGVNVVFRGDSRTPDKIQGKGTSPQTQVQTLREERGMTKPWHPFLNAGKSVYVRNGEVNKDNCLFSAVSVTPQLYVATKFPLLQGLTGECPEQVGWASAKVRDVQVAAAAAAPVSAFQAARRVFANPVQVAAERSLKLPASRTNVYGVVMRGGYNTQNYQQNSEFPEYASENLSWGDHLVWFSITRIHYGLDGNYGHLIVVNDHGFLQDPQVISAALMGPGSMAALRIFVDDFVSRGTLRAGVGGIPYTPPGVEAPFEIVRVQEPFVKM